MRKENGSMPPTEARRLTGMTVLAALKNSPVATSFVGAGSDKVAFIDFARTILSGAVTDERCTRTSLTLARRLTHWMSLNSEPSFLIASRLR